MGEDFSAPLDQTPSEREGRLLDLIHRLVGEADARYAQFRGEPGPTGYTVEQLISFLEDAQRFDSQFTTYEAEAQKLADAGLPAARSRLAEIQHHLQHSIVKVQEAYHLLKAHELRTALPTDPPEFDQSANAGDELGLIANERILLPEIEALYRQFCRAGEAFAALCAQYSYGPPTAILEEHWRELVELDRRFATCDHAANLLAVQHRPAAQQRLSLVRSDLTETIAIVKKMHAARSEADSRAFGPDGEAAENLTQSMLEMSRILRQGRGGQK
jgi:hypothetical protein